MGRGALLSQPPSGSWWGVLPDSDLDNCVLPPHLQARVWSPVEGVS